MLFEDLYDSVLRRYRMSLAKVEQERQVVRGRLYELLDATRPANEKQTKKVQEENVKGKDPFDSQYWP
ncbi:MAG TPA: hypothetical protein VKB49_28260 [Candidatus Sulfotelmatobacter sp.]|nr:hypothetical protein [Candidatus Sulfotelmatobacter sp.]